MQRRCQLRVGVTCLHTTAARFESTAKQKKWYSLYEYIFRECVLKRWFSWAAMVWMTMTMVAVMIPELILTRIGKVDIWAHVRCDLVMWGVRGRDPFVHKSVTARLGWSRSNIMFVVLNQILPHWVGFETKKTNRNGGMYWELESAFLVTMYF